MITIGYTKKPHGLKGEIKVEVEERYLDSFIEVKTVFLNLRGADTPFFLENIRIGNAIIAKFEDINTPEDAAALGSKEIRMRKADIRESEDADEGIEDDIKTLTGFRVEDMELGSIGTIEEIAEFPQQAMAFVQYQEKQVMVPLHPAFIVKIDDRNRVIYVNLPEGLLEL